MSSLPVPLSPWISTVAELFATWVTRVIMRRHAGLTPMAAPCARRASSRCCSALFSWMSARRSSAFRMTRTSWARWNGFVRKSTAPSFIARTASSTVPKAVSMITSRSGLIVLTSRSSSRPLRPGILRSESTRSMPPPRNRSIAACPSGASTTV